MAEICAKTHLLLQNLRRPIDEKQVSGELIASLVLFKPAAAATGVTML